MMKIKQSKCIGMIMGCSERGPQCDYHMTRNILHGSDCAGDLEVNIVPTLSQEHHIRIFKKANHQLINIKIAIMYMDKDMPHKISTSYTRPKLYAA